MRAHTFDTVRQGFIFSSPQEKAKAEFLSVCLLVCERSKGRFDQLDEGLVKVKR